VYERFSPNVSDSEFIKHIWVAAREICDDQIVDPQACEYLSCNHARLSDVVGANRRFVSAFLQHGGYDILEQFIGEPSLGTIDIADTRNEKTGFGMGSVQPILTRS
jgi:hypothetical protein